MMYFEEDKPLTKKQIKALTKIKLPKEYYETTTIMAHVKWGKTFEFKPNPKFIKEKNK